MNAISFRNGRIVTDAGIADRATFAFADERLVSVDGDASEAGIDLEEGWLLPGFIDTQVNGGGGVLFNDDISVATVATIGRAHAAYGTTAFLPTLISDELEAVARALDVVDAAIAGGVPGVVGIHLEGPFLNPARRGIHEARHFVALDDRAIGLLTRPRRGVVMVTLAPERCTATGIVALARAGVKVSAGHTDATYDEAVAAMDAGLDGVTHLFNAMPPMLHRAPGVAGAALDTGRAWCGLIADGFHLDPAVFRIAARALPPDRVMLVTDAMSSVGAASKDFVLQGKPVTVSGGRCSGPDGQLAGSDLDMAQAVRNAVAWTGASPGRIAAMASTNPAAYLRLGGERGSLRPGARADWVWLDRELTPRGTWIGGLPATPDLWDRWTR